MAAALRSGGPARIGGEPLRSGPFGAIARQRGLRAAIAVPIVVEGCYWGVTVAATEQSDFPPGHRVADGGLHGARGDRHRQHPGR
jgi:hypothetical protein